MVYSMRPPTNVGNGTSHFSLHLRLVQVQGFHQYQKTGTLPTSCTPLCIPLASGYCGTGVCAGGWTFHALDQLLLAHLALLCPLTLLDNASIWTPQIARPLCPSRRCDLPAGLREEDTAPPTTLGLRIAEISCVS